jgi:hypothetical protein
MLVVSIGESPSVDGWLGISPMKRCLPDNAGRQVRELAGSDQIDLNVDVAACSSEIRTGLVRLFTKMQRGVVSLRNNLIGAAQGER